MAGWLENQDSSGIFIWKKLQSYCLCLTLELRAEEWGRKRENASQISGAKQISWERKPHVVFGASDLEKSLKANLFANLWVQDFVGCSLVGILFGFVLWWLMLLLFFFSVCLWKQTRGWFGGSNRRSYMIIPGKSIAVPSKEEPHICRNDQLVLWRHCLIWLNLLKNLKSAPSLKRHRLADPPSDQTQQLNQAFIALFVFPVKQSEIFCKGGTQSTTKNYLLYPFISGKLGSPCAMRSQLGVGLVMEDSCKQMCWVN